MSVINATYLSKIDLPHLESLQELNYNNFELIYQFLLYLSSNLNAKCNPFSYCLDELPLICLVDPKAKVP